MQYPIIDNLTQAYITNGWTGLDIVEGKNIFHVNENEMTVNGWNRIFPFTINPGTYVISCQNSFGTPSTLGCSVVLTDSDNLIIANLCHYSFGESTFIGSPVTITNEMSDSITTITFRFRTNGGTYSAIENAEIQIELGTIPTPYEPYNPNPSNDFPNRLKLPLPHYFPHPVIDALQRAAAGTQTTDDTEILRHYLTPLGIGGI